MSLRFTRGSPRQTHPSSRQNHEVALTTLCVSYCLVRTTLFYSKCAQELLPIDYNSPRRSSFIGVAFSAPPRTRLRLPPRFRFSIPRPCLLTNNEPVNRPHIRRNRDINNAPICNFFLRIGIPSSHLHHTRSLWRQEFPRDCDSREASDDRTKDYEILLQSKTNLTPSSPHAHPPFINHNNPTTNTH